jgi:hypothetical protein
MSTSARGSGEDRDSAELACDGELVGATCRKGNAAEVAAATLASKQWHPADTVSPGFRPSRSAKVRVIEAAISMLPAKTITSAMTLPSFTSLIVPRN